MKKRHSNPFPLVFGFLVVFSGGLLPVQVLGNQGQESDADILIEARETPPIISSDSPDTSKPEKLHSPAKVFTKDENPEDLNMINSESLILPPSAKDLFPGKNVEKVQNQEETLSPPKISKPEIIPKISITPKIQKSPKPKTKKASLSETSPPKKRKLKKRKSQAVSIPTEIPPEWNWFSSPMKVVYNGSSVSVVTAYAAVPVERVSPVHHGKRVSPPSFESSKPVLASKGKDLFAGAFQMAAITKKIVRKDALKRGLVLPSQGGSIAHVPPSLIRLKEALNQLSQKSVNHQAISFSTMDPAPMTSSLKSRPAFIPSGVSCYPSGNEMVASAASSQRFTQAFDYKVKPDCNNLCGTQIEISLN